MTHNTRCRKLCLGLWSQRLQLRCQRLAAAWPRLGLGTCLPGARLMTSLSEQAQVAERGCLLPLAGCARGPSPRTQ